MKKLSIVFLLLFFIFGVAHAINPNSLPQETQLFSNEKIDIYVNTAELQNVGFSNYKNKEPFSMDIVIHIKNKQIWLNTIKEKRDYIQKNPTAYVVLDDLNNAKYLVEETDFDFNANKATILKEYFTDDNYKIIAWHSMNEEYDLNDNNKILCKAANNMKNLFESVLNNQN